METIEQKLNGKDLLALGPKTISHIRKNHALEHATIHVLSTKHPGISFAGYSIHKGFWVLGKTDIQTIQDAVEIAYARLAHGEKKLAVHPNCGTNLAMAGLCCAVGSLIATAGADSRKERISRLSSLTLAGVAGTYFGKPLGMKVQKYLTTDPDVKNINIVSISLDEHSSQTPAFFIETTLD